MQTRRVISRASKTGASVRAGWPRFIAEARDAAREKRGILQVPNRP